MTLKTKNIIKKHTLQGSVIKKIEKTITVEIGRKIKHLKYGKFLNIKSKYIAHDEKNACKIGDNVVIQQSRSYSRRKAWSLFHIVERKSE
jgi:small subunit ribosomal protein S17